LSTLFARFFCGDKGSAKRKSFERKNKKHKNKLLDISREVNYNSALWLKERINLPKENVDRNTAFLPARRPKAATRFCGAGAKRAGKS